MIRLKIIEQIKLFFREGTSDKVYEIDLIEVENSQYVVNFRYGRFGTHLKDGTKTPLPVPEASAKSIYDKLILSKTDKGYRTSTSAPHTTHTPSQPAIQAGTDPRRQAILKRLGEGDKSRSNWSLDRGIWRAADIALPEAVPILERLLGKSRERDYAILAALGNCSTPQAIDLLRSRFKGAVTNLNDMLERMNILALMKCCGEEQPEDVIELLIQKLPVNCRELLLAGNADGLAALLRPENGGISAPALKILYLLDLPVTRPAILSFLRETPLQPPAFQQVRHIFKAAEYRRDAEVFGLIAYRFETTRAMYTRPAYCYNNQFYVCINGSYTSIHKDSIKHSDTQVSYSSQTRTYLRQRVWRTLRRMGRMDDPDYVRMAVGVLLPFRDEDALTPQETIRYEWDGENDYRRVSRWWDSYSRYHAFNGILHTNSRRYQQKPPAKGWVCREGYIPGSQPPTSREEAFPHLWDHQPQGLLHLISESGCETVHGFTVRALRANRPFIDTLEIEPLTMLLGSRYDVSARLGYELTAQRLNDQSFAADSGIILALAGCRLPEARALAITTIERMQQELLADDTLWANLLLSQHADIRSFTEQLLILTPPADHTALAVLARIIAHLMAFKRQDQGETARRIAQATVKALECKLHLIDMEIIRDLLAHPLAAVQELGADILVKHNLPAAGIPDQILRSLLDSDHETIRAFGVRLIGRFSDSELLERETLLASLAIHRLEDIRTAIRPVIRRLAASQPEFGQRVAQQMLQILLRSRLGEELLNDLARLLKGELLPHLLTGGVDGTTVWRLLNGKSPAAQDVGGTLLATLEPESLELMQLTKLADHEILSVREGAWNLIERSLERVKNELPNAIRLLDAKWDDSRERAFRLFRERFRREDFTPEALVAICDSTRDEVQQFGRTLMTEHFNSADRDFYLSRLSEHPSGSMQLFVTSFIEEQLTGNPNGFSEFEPFFRDCLTRVNRGRAVKQRVLHYLQQEATRSEASASQVVSLLSDLSASASLEISSACIQTLLQIRQIHPELATPLKIRETGVRHAL